MITNSKIPIRVHWSRKADSKKPENTKYVGRPTNKKYWPGRWGNPYVTKKYGGPYTNAEAVELYREYVKDRHTEIIAELRGKNLMCKCSLNEPCHADVLLEIANR